MLILCLYVILNSVRGLMYGLGERSAKIGIIAKDAPS
jgi:hypothetical protein